MKSLDRRLKALERRGQTDDTALSPFDAAWLDKFGWLPAKYCYCHAAHACCNTLPDTDEHCTCERTSTPPRQSLQVFFYDLKESDR